MNSNKFIIHTCFLIFVALAFGLTACGGGGDTAAVPAAPVTPTALTSVDGTWVSSCIVDGDTSSNTTFIYTNGTGSVLEKTYSDTTCTTISMQQEAGFSYTLGSALTAPVAVNGPVVGLITANKINVTYTSGQVGGYFDIVAIKNNSLFTGDDNGTNDGTTEALRPTQLDGSVVYRRR